LKSIKPVGRSQLAENKTNVAIVGVPRKQRRNIVPRGKDKLQNEQRHRETERGEKKTGTVPEKQTLSDAVG
jgi:hypothetical protein